MLFNVSDIQALCDKYGFLFVKNVPKVLPCIYVSSNIFSTAKDPQVRNQLCCAGTMSLEEHNKIDIIKFYPNFEMEFEEGLRCYRINSYGIYINSQESLLEAFKVTYENFAYAQSCWKQWYNEYKLSAMEKDFKC